MIISRKKFNQEVRKEYWRGFKFGMKKAYEDMKYEALNILKVGELNANNIKSLGTSDDLFPMFGDPTKDPGSLAEQMTREEINHFADEMRKVRAQSQAPGWIPVNERLPEPNTAVLIYVSTGPSETFCLAYWNDDCGGWEEWIGIRMIETEMEYKVLAWQSLPEPYREVEE